MEALETDLAEWAAGRVGETLPSDTTVELSLSLEYLALVNKLWFYRYPLHITMSHNIPLLHCILAMSHPWLYKSNSPNTWSKEPWIVNPQSVGSMWHPYVQVRDFPSKLQFLFGYPLHSFYTTQRIPTWFWGLENISSCVVWTTEIYHAWKMEHKFSASTLSDPKAQVATGAALCFTTGRTKAQVVKAGRRLSRKKSGSDWLVWRILVKIT